MGKLRPFRCKLCSSSYKRRDHLVRHQKSEHESKRTVCILCGITTSRRDQMLRHLRTKHMYAPPPSGSEFSPFLGNMIDPPGQHFLDSMTQFPINAGGASPVVDTTEDPFEEIANKISPEAVPVPIPTVSAACVSSTDPAPVLTPLQPVVIDCKDTSEEYILGYGGDEVVTLDEGDQGNGVRMETDTENNENTPLLRSIIEDYRNIDNDDLFKRELITEKEKTFYDFDDKKMINHLLSELPEENEDLKDTLLIKKEIDDISNDNILFNLVPGIPNGNNFQDVQKTAALQVKKENGMNACNSQGSPETILIDDDSVDSGGNDADLETERLEPDVSSSRTSSVAVQTDNAGHCHSTEEPIDCEIVVTSDLTKQVPVPKQLSTDSYCRMITRAILSSPDRRISLEELLSFIPKHYPYFSTRPDGWQASIQDYLGRSKHFVRDFERDFDTWILNPATESKTIARYSRGSSEKIQMDSVCSLTQCFPCPDCGLKYRRKDHLKRHQSVAHRHRHGASRLECNVCRVKYSRSETLKRHMELFHKSGVIPSSPTARAPPAGVPSVTDRPEAVPYATASPTGILSAATRPAAVPFAAASHTGIPSVAAQPTPVPPAGIPYASTPPAEILSVADRPASVPYAAASSTGIPSVVARPAGIPSVADQPASVPYVAASSTEIPSEAARPAAVPYTTAQPAGIPSVADQPASVPYAAASSTEIPSEAARPAAVLYTTAQPAGIPSVADQAVAVPYAAASSTGIPSVAAPSAGSPSVSAQPACFPCLDCGLKYRRKQHLKRHQLRTHGASRLECNMCGAKYSRSETLKRHMELFHESCVIPSSPTARAPEFPVAAPPPGVPSVAAPPVVASSAVAPPMMDPDYLPGMDLDDMHEPRFTCPDCGLSYRRKTHLNRHQATTHSEATAFECYICGVKMRRHDNLQLHMKRIHGPGATTSSPTFSSAGPLTVQIET